MTVKIPEILTEEVFDELDNCIMEYGIAHLSINELDAITDILYRWNEALLRRLRALREEESIRNQ